jgi:hypothetical protein
LLVSPPSYSAGNNNLRHLGRIISGKTALLARTIQRSYGVLGPYDEL